uniref:Uncharacterized protein n=1 Tax=Tanacetum cinerariifolium TaxID=118510 RepID=A0A699HC73_TANCI|nr:hypothetical protein [Tanacetum cinerariifolium]
MEDLKELAEYEKSPSKDRPIFLNDNEVYSVQNEESLENSSNEIIASNSNQGQEIPPQDSDIHQLIEECSTKVSEEQKQSMEDTMLELEEEVKNVVEQPAKRGNRIESLQNFRVIHKTYVSLNNTSQISLIHAVTPILSTKEPEYSPSLGYENSNTTPETESDEIIKSGVEELVLILSENEVTLEDKRECDVPISENSPICDDHSEIFSDSKNDDDISVYDDDFEDVEYVEASLPDPEIVSIEEENVLHQAKNDVNQEEEEVDLEDISQIQDVDLREKLLSITRFISNIESLNANPIPDLVLNSSISIPIFKESDNSLSDNFSPEFKTFCDHTEETRSGNTTTHANDFIPEYDSFCFEIEPDQERLINVVKSNISNESSNDSLLEEADLFLASDKSIPSGIENSAEDPKGDIRFLEELLIDDSILSHESSDSNFEDNPSVPLPPPEPPDAETNAGEEIPVVMNDKDKFNEDYYFFMFDKVFSLLSAESEDTIFDPDEGGGCGGVEMVTVVEWSRGEEMMEVVMDGMTMWWLSSAVAGVGRNLAGSSGRQKNKEEREWG